jgi:hypothetical protein
MQGFRGDKSSAWGASFVLMAPVLAVIVIGFLRMALAR